MHVGICKRTYGEIAEAGKKMKLAPNLFALATNKEKFPDLVDKGAFAVDLGDCRTLNEKGYDIYWTMNGFDVGKRQTKDLKWINCFYADLDSGTWQQMQKKIKLYPEPSSVIKTGKGYHCYWYLENEINCSSDAEELALWYKAFLKQRIIPALNADVQAQDATRLLRAPFYKYWKSGNGETFIDLIYENGATYSLDFLEKHFPIVHENKKEEKEFNYAPTKISTGDSLWVGANKINCRSALEMLSGTSHVSGERYTFKKEGGGRTRIVIDGAKRNCWLDHNGKIGSTDAAGPSIPNWIFYYQKDWKRVAEILKEVFVELRGSI